jgi:hypothetical protein
MLFAVCGQDRRMVIKKIYKSGDLCSKETQVCEKDLEVQKVLLQGDIVKKMRFTYEIIDLPDEPKAKAKAKNKKKVTSVIIQ